MANEAAAGGRDSIWTDLRFRSILAQTLVFGLAVLFLFALTYNAARNMGSLGKEISFWFLTQPAGFDIPLTLIPYSPTSPVLDVYFVGLLNTLLVSSLGCALATMLGFVLAMMRLSRNWLLSRIVYCYVEFMRNIPLLLQIIFWYAILLGLPRWNRADSPWFGFYLNNRGLFGPAPDLQPAFWWDRRRFSRPRRPRSLSAGGRAPGRRRPARRFPSSGRRSPSWRACRWRPIFWRASPSSCSTPGRRASTSGAAW